jgi:hypothetical protein
MLFFFMQLFLLSAFKIQPLAKTGAGPPPPPQPQAILIKEYLLNSRDRVIHPPPRPAPIIMFF